MKKLSRRSTIYTVENVLVLVMIGSAIALQVIMAKKGKNEREPLLVKLFGEISDELIPWPFDQLASVITKATK